jgi:rfaE bifunctional protein nucleotidyltransferase chain/domain
MNFRNKIIAWDKLSAWRNRIRDNKKLVVTNGVFDILHLGHVTYLQKARNFGNALLVGINSDDAVRLLKKGPDRPINSEDDRAAILAALQSVSGVCVFTEVTATAFLAAARPHIYVKGGDYTLETLNQDERRAVESEGGEIKIIPLVPGRSTTALLGKISRL